MSSNTRPTSMNESRQLCGVRRWRLRCRIRSSWTTLIKRKRWHVCSTHSASSTPWFCWKRNRSMTTRSPVYVLCTSAAHGESVNRTTVQRCCHTMSTRLIRSRTRRRLVVRQRRCKNWLNWYWRKVWTSKTSMVTQRAMPKMWVYVYACAQLVASGQVAATNKDNCAPNEAKVADVNAQVVSEFVWAPTQLNYLSILRSRWRVVAQTMCSRTKVAVIWMTCAMSACALMIRRTWVLTARFCDFAGLVAHSKLNRFRVPKSIATRCWICHQRRWLVEICCFCLENDSK